MAELRGVLLRLDAVYLEIIGQKWMNSPISSDRETLTEQLAAVMTNTGILSKQLEAWPKEQISALSYLLRKDGRASAADFCSKFGEIRAIGLGRILRESIWQNPQNGAEALWYAGVIYKETGVDCDGLRDDYVIPVDLLAALRTVLPISEKSDSVEVPHPLVVRPASPIETTFVQPADESMPDILCTLLAAERSGQVSKFAVSDYNEEHLNFAGKLLQMLAFSDAKGTVDTEKIKRFLNLERPELCERIRKKWLESPLFDELRENNHDFIIPQDLAYDAAAVRQEVCSVIDTLNERTWFSLNGFLSAMDAEHGDFLRRHIDGISWQIFDVNGNSLTGNASRHLLEGAYLKYLISEPLYRLGLVDLAYSDKSKSHLTAFRRHSRSVTEENSVPTFTIDGLISCRFSVPRIFRYQAARYCQIEKLSRGNLLIRVTPESLARAGGQGLDTMAFLQLLRRYGGNSVPRALENTILSWKQTSAPVLIYPAVILTLPTPKFVPLLLDNPRIEKYILQRLNERSFVIDRKGIEFIRRFLMEKEIFVNIEES